MNKKFTKFMNKIFDKNIYLAYTEYINIWTNKHIYIYSVEVILNGK